MVRKPAAEHSSDILPVHNWLITLNFAKTLMAAAGRSGA
jgi:hypothetical protein